MALKSKEWFYKLCLQELGRVGPLYYLCWHTLMKGVGQSDATRGHVTQAIGCVQEFFDAHPSHKASVCAADKTIPFDLGGDPAMLKDWKSWLKSQGPDGKLRVKYGYSYEKQRSLLPPKYGGKLGKKLGKKKGGGGLHELKRVMRILAALG